MGISTIQNFYKETITRAVTLTGATSIYLSALPTPSEGYVVISPSSSTLREIVYYTAKGTDGNGNFITVTLANRGLGGTTAQTHVIGEPVRMNVTAEHIKEISDALDQIVAGGAQDASTITKGITKLSVAPASATSPIAVGTNDPRVPTADPTTIFAPIKFGGTGTDGALAITTGTTTIDLGGVQVFTKNYTSISITGTGSLAFSNPHANGTLIILKSQGNVTLTSSQAPMIDASGIGGAQGSNGGGIFSTPTAGGTGGNPAAGSAGGAHVVAFSGLSNFVGGVVPWIVGAGGGRGGIGSGSSGGVAGIGGRGGGSLIIQCGGAFNFTTASGISVAGKNGTNGALGTGTLSSGGGGGGGAGGTALILYNSLTASTGTITATGGSGGTGNKSGSAGIPGGGGGGGGGNVAGTIGNAGAGLNGGDGGAGANGYSLVAQNTEFN